MAAVQNNHLSALFGGAPVGGINPQQLIGFSTQANTETVAVGTTRRSYPGPTFNGHFSLQVFVDSAGGAGSALTVWYSNLPNPSLASDADWSQDTTIGSVAIDTTVGSPKMFNVGNVDAEWVMAKAVVATSTANLRVVARVEGVTHNPAD